MPKPEKLNGATAVVDEPTPQTAEQMAETEQALAPATKAPLPMGVMPKTAEEAWRLAKMIALSDLVPKGYRGRAADILVAMQYGAEVNLPPMQALHSIYVTNGRPQLWGDGLLAVIMASPKYKDHDEYFLVGGKRQDFLVEGDLQTSTTMAVTTFWRADSPRPRTATFSVAQAKRAGLLSKQGPWQEYPDRMFKMRARSWAAHDAFPDVLRGIASREEVRDGALVETAEPAPAPKIVRRISETPAPADTPAPAAAETVTIGPVGVTTIDQYLGGYTITVASGQQFDVEDDLVAVEVEKFLGTDHALTFTCTKDGKRLLLQSLELAE